MLINWYNNIKMNAKENGGCVLEVWAKEVLFVGLSLYMLHFL